MASSEDATTAASRSMANDAWRWRVMSRAIFEAPTTVPASSRIGETLSEIGSRLPSFRCRMVSKWLTARPARMVERTVSSSACRSAG